MHSATNRLPTMTAVLALTAALSVVGCGGGNPPAQDTATTSTTSGTAAATGAAVSPEPAQSASATTQPTQTAPTSTCVQDDHSYAPGGYCLYPGKVTWLDGDVLPVDPATLDWTDADAVARAYVITANTWDSRVDVSGSYAWRRAQIFEETGRTDPDPTDPDTARGFPEFANTWQAESYTSVEIHSVSNEGTNPDPLQPDGTWRRVVTYTRTVHTRADGGTPYVQSGAWYVTLAVDPATGQWLVRELKTSAETDDS